MGKFWIRVLSFPLNIYVSKLSWLETKQDSTVPKLMWGWLHLPNLPPLLGTSDSDLTKYRKKKKRKPNCPSKNLVFLKSDCTHSTIWILNGRSFWIGFNSIPLLVWSFEWISFLIRSLIFDPLSLIFQQEIHLVFPKN